MNKKGPFGIYMGMSLNDVGSNPEQIAPGGYKLTNVPKPHSAFESYLVKATPQYGISMVKAIGKNIETSVYGQELQSAFKEMKNKLFSIYGKHETTDALLPGSIWNEPKDWMQGRLIKERILFAMWSKDKGSQMIDDLNEIALSAEVLNTRMGYIVVEYHFSNDDINNSVIQAQEDDAL